jgi:hypothetical protein
MRKARSDKKFGVKVWVKSQDKDLFRTHCFEYHLSMMFVAEKYLTTCLDEFSDAKLYSIIEKRLDKYLHMKSTRDEYEVLGLKLTNNYWQKLAYFAVRYKTSVAKIASCLFEYCLSAYEIRGIEEKYGLVFNYNRRKNLKTRSMEDLDTRVSDY